MTYEAIINTIKKKEFAPVYLLHGLEPYYIDKISDYIEEHVLDESQREFDLSIFYGKDSTIESILGAARRFPMMSPYQVILVKEAQHLVEFSTRRQQIEEEGEEKAKVPKVKKDADAKETDPFLIYLNKPLPSTILVFCCKNKKVDAKTKLYKAINQKDNVVFLSEEIREYNIQKWIEAYVHSRNCKINSKASLLLSEYLGTHLGKIVNEIEKLIINLKSGEEISTELIEKYIGISKDYNVFELQKALGSRNAVVSYRIVNYFGANQKENHIIPTIASLYGYFIKLMAVNILPDKSRENVASALKVHPFYAGELVSAAKNYPPVKINRIISDLSELDLKVKGVKASSTEPGELLREMVARILN